ncbi:tyrosine-type recombinase/integrase [Burkholderia ubonensis]|uniref:tyrosine-type recombinase/integrase n=1 Tax=Burkholderia ubonensis TaxID=101571 RepID=UPI0009B2ED0F|nr:tyrosine-type recombinase/integrase [Burkholderia ubonensis]
MNLQSLIDQFITYRQSLGDQFLPNCTVKAFGRFVGSDIGMSDVTDEQVNRFLRGSGPITLTWHIKLSGLRTFYQYATSRGYVARAPLPTVVPKRPPPFVPYVYSHEELRSLLQAAKEFDRPSSMEPGALHLILLVLYATGLRVREVVNLNREDVNVSDCLITVLRSKFGKTRLVPFTSQLQPALLDYEQRHSAYGNSAPFFLTRCGGRVKTDTLQHNYRILCDRIGIRRHDRARYQPRIHDLRHTFAVHRVTSWYQQGANVQALLPLLSIYLGHVHIRATQVYLSTTPELLDEAGKRFERYAMNEVRHDR